MAGQKYNLALEITADGTPAVRSMRRVGATAERTLGGAGGRISRMFDMTGGKLSGLLGPISSVGKALTGAFGTALTMVGSIAKALAGLPIRGLKMGLGALAAGGAAVFATHKALSPAAEMERYKIQLGALGKGDLYNFLTKASAGKPFQMGESVQAGVLMESFRLDAKSNLSTVMDTAAAFKKPLEDIVRMLGFARSGRTGEALESAARVGINRDDLRALGLKFEKSGAVIKGMENRLLPLMLKLMRNRFGGLAGKIGTGSYQGAVSDLKDTLFRSFANAFESVLPMATEAVRGVAEIMTVAGKWAASFDWEGVGEGLLGYFNQIKTISKSMFREGGVDFLIKAVKQVDLFGAMRLDMHQMMFAAADTLLKALTDGLSFVARGITDILTGKEGNSAQDFAQEVKEQFKLGRTPAEIKAGESRFDVAVRNAGREFGGVPTGFEAFLPAGFGGRSRIADPNEAAATTTAGAIEKLAALIEKKFPEAAEEKVDEQTVVAEETRDILIQQNQILKQANRYSQGQLIQLP